MFFNQTGSPGGMPGTGASAFTSPGANPMSLAALMAMAGMGNGAPGQSPLGAGAGPQMPPPPAVGAGGAGGGAIARGGVPGALNQPPQNNLLASLLSNPNALKALMQQLGLGGGGAPAGGIAAAGLGGSAGGGLFPGFAQYGI
jgi:hypothetical protein